MASADATNEETYFFLEKDRANEGVCALRRKRQTTSNTHASTHARTKPDAPEFAIREGAQIDDLNKFFPFKNTLFTYSSEKMLRSTD